MRLDAVGVRFPRTVHLLRRFKSFVQITLVRIWHLRKNRRVIGRGNSISTAGATLVRVEFDIRGNDNRIRISPNVIMNDVKFFIRGNGHRISIETGCRFNRGGLIWFEDADGELLIGGGSTFEDVHFAVTENGSKIHIGNDCMFAYDIDVRTGDSHSVINAETGRRTNFAADVIIGDHVWICAHVSILKGVTIARDSIVGTGSVVSSKYNLPGTMIAGNPSRASKFGVTWSRARIPA